jgi:hypothetical protein
MATVTTSSISQNVALVPYAGEAWLGDAVKATPLVLSKPVIAAGGVAAGGNIPTVTVTVGAGTVAALTSQTGYDMACNFTFIAGTASISGGTLASVKFGAPLDVTPVAVMVSAAYSSGTVGLNVGASQLTSTGFNICGNAPTSGGTVTMNYFVVRSPL